MKKIHRILLFMFLIILLAGVLAYSYMHNPKVSNIPSSQATNTTDTNDNTDNTIKRLADDVNSDWALDAISANSYKNKNNKNNIIVAVIDTGVNLKSPNILQGYNILDGSSNILDKTNHGTNVTNLILRTSPNVKILPIKIIDDSTNATPENLAKGIKLAIDKGADIINISLGMTSIDESVKKQISIALQKNIAVVSSAGNTGGSLLYPASEEKVFSVVARDINNQDVAFSSKGTKKSFSAPGVHILIDNNTFVSGTSFACSFVTSAIAIIKESNKDASIDELLDILKQTSVDGNEYSYGLIRIDRISKKID